MLNCISHTFVAPRRDFRLHVLSGTGEGEVESGIEWIYSPVEDLVSYTAIESRETLIFETLFMNMNMNKSLNFQGNGQYMAEFDIPEEGHYLGFYIKVGGAHLWIAVIKWLLPSIRWLSHMERTVIWPSPLRWTSFLTAFLLKTALEQNAEVSSSDSK